MSRILQYVSGEDTLGVRADDSFWVTNKHEGATKTWTGKLAAGTHAELERLLLAAGFPNVPASSTPTKSPLRTLFYKDASASVACDAGGELAAYRALFVELDPIVFAAREGAVRGAMVSVAFRDPANPSPTEKLFADMFSNAPRRLSPKRTEKLDQALAHGRALIGMPDPSAPPNDVARAVASVVDRLRAEKDVDDATFIALGVVFGDALARATGWGWWMYMPRPGTPEVPVLLPENRAHMLYPIAFVIAQVRSERAPTLMLVFSMITSGQLPPSAVGALTELR